LSQIFINFLLSKAILRVFPKLTTRDTFTARIKKLSFVLGKKKSRGEKSLFLIATLFDMVPITSCFSLQEYEALGPALLSEYIYI